MLIVNIQLTYGDKSDNKLKIGIKKRVSFNSFFLFTLIFIINLLD